jgi:tetratricopeptide (TPR) repeat protein
MKKVMILLAVLLTANVMMAQKKDRTDAFMYNKNGQYAKAMASIEKCVNHEQFAGMKPNDQAQAWLYRAAIYQNIIQSGDEALMAQAPNALEIVYESLMNCMKNPEYLNDNKQEIYQRVGNVMNTYYTKGADDYNTGKFAEAAPMFKKAYDIAKSLGSSDANDMLNFAATSALRAEDYATALGYFNELKNNGVDGVDVYKHLAACYNGMGDSENAMAMINAGLEKDPSDASLIVEKVNAYMKEGKTVEAVEDINKLLALDPQNAQLLFVLGTIYGDENNKDVYDTEKAKKYYEDAIEINPDYYDAIYNLGALYITMSNKLKTEANELPLNKVKEYNDLVKQAEDLVRTGLPYVKKAYETQPTPEVKSVLKTMYVQLKMNEEAKALDAE